MKTLGNILWHFPFFGFLTALVNFILGGLLMLTIIGAPIGSGLIQLAKFQLTPFSKTLINDKRLNQNRSQLWDAYGTLVMILYFPFGLVIASITVIQIALLFISLVGIPAAIVLAKSLGTYFNPVNKKCVPEAVAKEIEKREAEKEVSNYFN